MYRMKKGKCSYCHKFRPTIKRMAADYQICDECVYLCDVALGKYVKGVVLCKGCGNWKSFVFYLAGGGSIKMECRGIGGEDMPMYVPVSSSDKLQEAHHPVKAIKCTGCAKSVPTWLIGHNDFLKTYFVEINNGPTTDSQPENSAS
jgi:hypothetical protein